MICVSRCHAMNGGELLTRLEFYDVNDVVAGSIDAVLTEGDNYIKTPVDQFYRMDIVIEGQAGQPFASISYSFGKKKPCFQNQSLSHICCRFGQVYVTHRDFILLFSGKHFVRSHGMHR